MIFLVPVPSVQDTRRDRYLRIYRGKGESLLTCGGDSCSAPVDLFVEFELDPALGITCVFSGEQI